MVHIWEKGCCTSLCTIYIYILNTCHVMHRTSQDEAIHFSDAQSTRSPPPCPFALQRHHLGGGDEKKRDKREARTALSSWRSTLSTTSSR